MKAMLEDTAALQIKDFMRIGLLMSKFQVSFKIKNLSVNLLSQEKANKLLFHISALGIFKNIQTNKCFSLQGESIWDIFAKIKGYTFISFVWKYTGDKFPLDSSNVPTPSADKLKAGKSYTLPCQAVSNVTEIQSRATLIWSFGTPSEQTTTVIGRLTLPESSILMSDLGDKACYNITSEGSLHLNDCSQDGDIRFWCHVFLEHDMLRSYVDMSSDGECTWFTSFFPCS